MIDIDYGIIRVKLADIMKEHNISINKLANRAEMQRSQVRTYMNGKAKRIDLAILARLCSVLGCTVPELMEYIPPARHIE